MILILHLNICICLPLSIFNRGEKHLYFGGLFFTSLCLNVQHWISVYIAVYHWSLWAFSGAPIWFSRALFCISGVKLLQSPFVYFLSMIHICTKSLHCIVFFFSLIVPLTRPMLMLGAAPSSSGFSWVGQASRHLSLSSRQESQLSSAVLSCSQPGVYDLSSIRVSAIPADLAKTKKSVLQQRLFTVSANSHTLPRVKLLSLMSGPRCIELSCNSGCPCVCYQ